MQIVWFVLQHGLIVIHYNWIEFSIDELFLGPLDCH